MISQNSVVGSRVERFIRKPVLAFDSPRWRRRVQLGNEAVTRNYNSLSIREQFEHGQGAEPTTISELIGDKSPYSRCHAAPSLVAAARGARPSHVSPRALPSQRQ